MLIFDYFSAKISHFELFFELILKHLKVLNCKFERAKIGLYYG
jgi:hypothetical protein